MTYPADALGIEGPPNPEDLTEHILLPERGDKDPERGINVFYGIVHQTEELPDHKAFPDAIPDVPTDIREDVIRSGRQDLTPAVREAPSASVITFSKHIAPADQSLQVLAQDDRRRRAVVSIVPDDFSAAGGLAYLANQSIGNAGPIGTLVCASAVAPTMVREFTCEDEVWIILDATSKPCWVSVHIERY